jgi:hypothetical protein
MSAIAAFLRRRSVYMMTDALSYIDGVPHEVDCHKAHVIDGMRAVLSCTGPGGLGEEMAEVLGDGFTSFDCLVGHGSDLMKETFERHVAAHRAGDAISVLAIIGWHETSDRPALYSMSMGTDGAKAAWARKNDPHQGRFDGPRFELHPFECLSTPCPTKAQFDAARYNMACDFEKVDPATDLLHQLEIARRVMVDGRSFVGGNALLTTIDASGIAQRVVHRWEDDAPGKPISPQPINWKRWRSDRERAYIANLIPSGLSRLQRERMAKKAAKGTLRGMRP